MSNDSQVFYDEHQASFLLDVLNSELRLKRRYLLILCELGPTKIAAEKTSRGQAVVVRYDPHMAVRDLMFILVFAYALAFAIDDSDEVPAVIDNWCETIFRVCDVIKEHNEHIAMAIFQSHHSDVMIAAVVRGGFRIRGEEDMEAKLRAYEMEKARLDETQKVLDRASVFARMGGLAEKPKC